MAYLENYKYWRCRQPYSHEWTEMNLNEEEVRKPKNLGRNPVFISVTCPKCTTTKWRWVFSNGGMTGWRYEYPDGYRIDQDTLPNKGRNVQFRVAFYKRVTMRRR